MNNKQIYVDLDIHLIQQIRLIQAIAESVYPVSIPKEQQYKFLKLTEKFSFKFSEEPAEISTMLSEAISVNHRTPKTCIGELCRPLIFPHEICSYCKTLWKDSRELKFSFVGLETKERKNVIENWKEERFKQKPGTAFSSAINILREKIQLRIGNKMSHRQSGQLHSFASRRGRDYPTKAWDEIYYKILANSEFVLCPRGKSDWTYRFYEAILCGAIPVVEKDCEVYSGFKYHFMHEPKENLLWSRETAEYNYQLCLERITIPLPLLNKTLEALIVRAE